MNALQQTGMSVRLGWERTKYHKQAYRHTRFSELAFLSKEPIRACGFFGWEVVQDEVGKTNRLLQEVRIVGRLRWIVAKMMPDSALAREGG
jgi:hypothetical protein